MKRLIIKLTRITAVIIIATLVWSTSSLAQTNLLLESLASNLVSLADFKITQIDHQSKSNLYTNASYNDRYIQKNILGPPIAWVSDRDNTSDTSPERLIMTQAFSDSVSASLDLARFNRFDDNTTFDFDSVLADLTTTDPTQVTAIGQVLASKLGESILTILNDPAYQASQKDRVQVSDSTTFSQIKGRSSSYTLKELERLMNSTYIYLPYIQSIDKKRKNNQVKLVVHSGLLWYKVTVNQSNQLRIIPVVTLAARQTIMYSAGDTDRDKKIRTAIGHTASRLVQKTQGYRAFQLASRIKSVSGRLYTLDLPASYSQLDDIFYLKEASLSKNDKIIYKTVGVLRVKPSNTSVRGYQQLGATRDRGGLAIESPRANIALRMSYYTAQYNGDLSIMRDGQVISDSIGTMRGIQGALSYNIGPKLGISQLFIGANLRYAQGSQNTVDTRANDYDIYLEKKVWWRNHGLTGLIGFGESELKVSHSTDQYTLSAPLALYGLGYDVMLTSRITANLRWQQVVALKRGDTRLVSESNSSHYAEYAGTVFDNTQVHIGLTIDF